MDFSTRKEPSPTSVLECEFISEVSVQLVNLDADLLHRITVTDRDCIVLGGVEVISDAERCSDLILSSVSLADVSAVIVLAVVFLAERCVDLGRRIRQLLK